MNDDAKILNTPGIHAGFRRWFKKTPQHTRYLVCKIFEELIPELLSHGFIIVNSGAPNYITLQRKNGEEWPVIEFKFDKRFRPYFWMSFAFLPPICKRMTKVAYIDIPREKADIIEGVVVFNIINKKPYSPYSGFGMFGIFSHLLSLQFIRVLHYLILPNSLIDSQIETAKSRLTEAMTVIDNGMKPEWYKKPPNEIGNHIIQVRSWVSIERFYLKPNVTR